jgi:hypothetical protein
MKKGGFAMARPVALVRETTEILDHAAAHKRFKEHLTKRPDLKKLQDEAKKRGYQLKDTAEETFAFRTTAKASGPVKAPVGAAAAAAPVQDVEVELVGQSVTKGRNQGAVVTCTVKAGKQEVSYDFYLEAPNGQFERATEWTIEGGKVVEARSWWSAWVGCLRSRCASACLSALWQCTGTWTAYFWCVVGKCGGCVLRCAACSTCDCSWWCRWAVGCCDR